MVRSALLLFILLFGVCQLPGQSLYYPPLTGNSWQTTDAASLGWDTTRFQDLRTFLDTTGTRAFMILKDGKIVVEYYFNEHNANKPWYWASAGKSLTSVMVACAQADGKLQLTDPTSKYLGNGWTSCTSEDEQKITIRHQITMTTGLDDNEFECTEPSCLKCLANPGSRWAYHNSPYTLLDGVIEGATGQDLNAYVKSRLSADTGINGLYIASGYNNVFYSTARVMARFGLLVLGKGKWNEKDIIKNPEYVRDMSQTSQNLNKSYGYLWWLNGKESCMLPQSQFVFPSALLPDAPADMFAALGKNDQKLYIIPSQNIVIVRMGDRGTPDNTAVPIVYDAMLWKKLNSIIKTTSIIDPANGPDKSWYNQTASEVKFYLPEPIEWIEMYDLAGKMMDRTGGCTSFSMANQPQGFYFFKVKGSHNSLHTTGLLWNSK